MTSIESISSASEFIASDENQLFSSLRNARSELQRDNSDPRARLLSKLSSPSWQEICDSDERVDLLTQFGKFALSPPHGALGEEQLEKLYSAISARANFQWFFNESEGHRFENAENYQRSAAINSMPFSDTEQWQIDLFNKLADAAPGGYWNPYVCILADWWQGVLYEDTLSKKVAARVQSYILSATRNPKQDEPLGFVARLYLEKIDQGIGAFYPHPWNGFRQKVTRKFQEGLQNGWWAAIGYDLTRPQFQTKGIDFDIRWWVEVKDANTGKLLDRTLDGRSGEVAVACALRALRQNQQLDSNAAVTAQFATPRSASFHIDHVGEINKKCLADEIRGLATAARVKSVNRIAIHSKQPRDTPDDKLGTVRLVPVDDFEDAYKELSLFEAMTAQVNERLAEEARQTLLKTCNAATESRYIPSPILKSKQEGPDRAKGDVEPSQSEQEKWIPISDDELCQINEGRFHGPGDGPARLFLYADSGVGKSTLLIYLEQQIAEGKFGLLPIRRDKLASRPWDDSEKFRNNLASEFGKHLDSSKKKHVQDWLQYLHDNGKAVYLLDAHDQAGGQVDQIQLWFEGHGNVDQCPIYFTGRQSSRSSFSAWDERQVGLLTDDQVNEFLTKEKAEHFRKLLGIEDGNSVENEFFRVPMVLHLLQSIPEDEIDSLYNRERVYYQAIESNKSYSLLSKGLDSVPRESRGSLTNLRKLTKAHAFVAWHMLRNVGFEGFVEGDQYDDTLEILSEYLHERNAPTEMAETLKQNGVLLGGPLEEENDSLQWRHLSFAEYFAGVWLADYLSPDELRFELSGILDMVAARTRAREGHAWDDPEATHEISKSPREQWRWVFRFALSRLDAAVRSEFAKKELTKKASGTKLTKAVEKRDRLAAELIAYGGTFTLADAIREDHFGQTDDTTGATVPCPWVDVCRWLVRDDLRYKGMGATERPENDNAEEFVRVLGSHLDRRYRDSQTVRSAWDLLPESAQQSLGAGFIGELGASELDVFGNLLQLFLPCPSPEFDMASADNLFPAPEGHEGWVYRMGSDDSDHEAWDDEKPARLVLVPKLDVMKFGVSNAEYELFDPSHFFSRDGRSRSDDQPVHRVTWHAADFYSGIWLACCDCSENFIYCLPSESEREFFTRGGTSWPRWWNGGLEEDRCHHSASRSLGRSESPDKKYANPFDLQHTIGNMWEWTSSEYRDDWTENQEEVGERSRTLIYGHEVIAPLRGSSRVCRGGSWARFSPRVLRSGYRFNRRPDNLSRDVGFRVCRRFVACPNRP